ncbi:MAG TPA: porin [Herbaspirillum sp.]|jgi:predicted porin
MKIGNVAVTVLGFFSAAAYAQNNVTIYGLVDTGIEYVSHADAAGHGVIRMPGVSGELPSRLGVRGVEDLGDGLKAVFVIENGFNMRGGDLGQGGRLFGRQSWVGLDGSWGTLSVGRQYSMAFWVLADADMLGPDIHGVGALDNYLPNARSDNTIAYKNTFKNGLTAGATYSFGRDGAGTGNSPGQGTCAGETAGRVSQCKEWSAMLKYDAARFGVAAAYDRQSGGANAAASFFDGVAPFTLSSADDRDERVQANGYVKFGGLKVGGGWIGRNVKTASAAVPDVRSNLFYVGASSFVTTALFLDGEAYRMIIKEHDTRATLMTLRATYFLSKTTAVYVKGGYLWNSDKARFSVSAGGGGTTPAAGMGQLGAMVGIRHSF